MAIGKRKGTQDQLFTSPNLVSQTDANNHTIRFEYDRLGRRTKRVLPLGQTESYTYDLVRNLATKTDFNGRTTTYAGFLWQR